MQPGDVLKTYADVEDLVLKIGFKPSTSLDEGLKALSIDIYHITKWKFNSNAIILYGGEDMDSKRERVDILWTGGFDSTFRMIQLSKLDVDVQPYYLKVGRMSERNELNAIHQLTELLVGHEKTKCTLLPLIIENKPEMVHYPDIMNAYYFLQQYSPFGIQYSWLAAFAKEHPEIEICLEKSPSCKIRKCIEHYGGVKKNSRGLLEYYKIDESIAHPDLMLILGAYRFPSQLFELTKFECKSEYINLGYKDFMDLTWFCHSPIHDKPCGLCNPCKSLISEHLEERLLKGGILRNKFRSIYIPLLKLKNRLNHKFFKTSF